MSDNSVKQILFKVQRFNPEVDRAPHFCEYSVPVKRGTTVLEGLLYIKENLDSSLAFRTSCRMGICGSCAMLVNGYPHLACHTQVEEFKSGELTIKPLANLPIIKDLVPALDSLFEKHKAINPYIIRNDVAEMEEPSREFVQQPHRLDEFLQFTYCIKCGICLSACPTSASDSKFLGPQALSQAYRYCADNRDEGEEHRLRIVENDHGLWNCHFAAACSDACPKGVDPALAIQLLRRKVLAKALNINQKKEAVVIVPPPTTYKPEITVPEFTAKLSDKD